MILPNLPNLAEIAYLQHLAEEEKEMQARIVRARDLDEGEFDPTLAAETAQRLVAGDAADIQGVNLMHIVLRTVVRRVDVAGLKAAGDKPQTEWLENVWDANAMDTKQLDVHRWAERDGESFVIVDYDPTADRAWDETGQGLPRFYIHERYTAAEQGGSNEGCKAHYRNDDPHQELEMVSKRWIETVYAGGKPESRQRMTLYIAAGTRPARIEKYIWQMVTGRDGRNLSQWAPLPEAEREPGEAWPIWWTETGREDGRSLPLPVVHFRNEEMQPITRRVWGLQNGMDHAWSGLMGALNQTAFRMYKAFGWMATTDGLPVKEDGSNRLEVSPGGIWGNATKGPNEASLEPISAESPEPILDTMDKIAIYCAFIAGLPINNFIASGQIAGAATLRQGEADLIAHANALFRLFGRSWSRVMELARLLDNLHGNGGHNIRAKISPIWAEPETANSDGKNDEAKAQLETGVPEEFIWRSVWGYDEEQVAEMKRLKRPTGNVTPIESDAAVNEGNMDGDNEVT